MCICGMLKMVKRYHRTSPYDRYVKVMHCTGLPVIYAGVMVYKASMLNGGRSGSRSAKFGVTVCKASMLD